MATYTQAVAGDFPDAGVSPTVVTNARTYGQTEAGFPDATASTTVAKDVRTYLQTEAGFPDATASTTVAKDVRTYRQTEAGFPDANANGVPIPTGDFRPVMVEIQDTEGNPIYSAEWIQSAGLFPTAARVRETADGRTVARMWLLRAAYEEFSVIADSGRESVDYVWHQQSTESGPAIGRSDREATLRFSPVELGGNNNMSVGYGASFGGT